MIITAKLLPPIQPNFIFYEVAGVKTEKPIPIENLTAEQAKEYSKLIAESFTKHWEKKKSEPKGSGVAF